MPTHEISNSKTNSNLGEAILVPSQAHLHVYNTSAKGRATLYIIPVQKAELLRYLNLRTRTGMYMPYPSLVPRPLPAFQHCARKAGGPGIRCLLTYVMPCSQKIGLKLELL